MPGFTPRSWQLLLSCSLEPPVTCGWDFRKGHAGREGLAVPAESRPQPLSAEATTGCLQDQQKSQLSQAKWLLGSATGFGGGLLCGSGELKH